MDGRCEDERMGKRGRDEVESAHLNSFWPRVYCCSCLRGGGDTGSGRLKKMIEDPESNSEGGDVYCGRVKEVCWCRSLPHGN